jgi:hypothetical protein
VLSIHVPTEDDEWMQFEMKILKEFTRIFPPEKREEKMFTEEPDGGDEEEGDEEDDPLMTTPAGTTSASAAASAAGSGSGSGSAPAGEKGAKPGPRQGAATTGNASNSNSNSNSANAGANSNAKPIATYDDILYQVFLQEKRQFMRMHQPLPRDRDAAGSGSLPPLETSSVRSTPFLTGSNGPVSCYCCCRRCSLFGCNHSIVYIDG